MIRFGKLLAELQKDGAAALSSRRLSKLREPILSAARAFFCSDNKNDFKIEGSLLGYFPIGSEKAVGETKPDSKEYLHFNPTLRLSPELAEPLGEAYAVCTDLSEKLLHTLRERELLPSTVTLAPASDSILRLIRYQHNQHTMSAAAHTDINLLSLLLCDDAPGLWFEDRAGNRVPVEHNDEQILVIAGDMLELATNGKIQSTKHGVDSGPPVRFSAVFFANPISSTLLSETTTAGESLNRRLKQMSEESGNEVRLD